MANSSLSSVVSDLVRAQMGASVSSTVTDDDLDRHVAELILKEARQKAERYGKDGYKAFLPQAESNAPRTNKRFLSSIIRNTDDHNKSILRAQALSAAEIRMEREEQERAERRARAEEAVAAERMRRLGGSSRRTSDDKWDRKGRKRSERSWKEREDEDEDERERYHSRRRVDDEDASRKSRRHRHRSRSKSRRDDDHHSSRRRSRSRSPISVDEDDDREARRSKRKRRSPSQSRDRSVDSDDDRRHKRRSHRHEDSSRRHHHRRRSRERTPRRSRSATLSEQEAVDIGEPNRGSSTHDTSDTVDRETELRRNLKGKGKSLDSPRPRSPVPVAKARSPSPSGPAPPKTSPPPLPRSRPRSPPPGPPPPGPTSPLSARPDLPSKMDKYFEESYDPRLDVAPLAAPKVPATGLIDNAEFEGWDAMLELIRMRREDKEEKKRMERLGLLDKDKDKKGKKKKVESGLTGEMNGWSEGGSNLMAIEYKKRGSVREWDMGKEVPT
ncbi:hypothetical protein BV25DRAFT_1988402 [Artomyces pyxidatus]|uniref:Uncharacterized protein n=1 Tax=Artomyces pyxidatus TaxID=48021 RepID=A0ACB8TE28_9AGAM|nr:hypothetical protein BV25DRAFT_1988402 [Artomyces pyxidatus]